MAECNQRQRSKNPLVAGMTGRRRGSGASGAKNTGNDQGETIEPIGIGQNRLTMTL